MASEFHDETVRLLLPFGFHTPKFRDRRGYSETSIRFGGNVFVASYNKDMTIDLVRAQARSVLLNAFEVVLE